MCHEPRSLDDSFPFPDLELDWRSGDDLLDLHLFEDEFDLKSTSPFVSAVEHQKTLVTSFCSSTGYDQVRSLVKLIDSRPSVEILNNHCTETGETILSMALTKNLGKYLLVKLLQDGANPCLADLNGSSAFFKSIQFNIHRQLILAYSHACLNHADENDRSALWWTVYHNGMESIESLSPAEEKDLRLLLPLCPKADNLGVTPLMLAASFGSTGTMMLLLWDGHSDVDAIDYVGRSAKEYAEIGCMNAGEVANCAASQLLEAFKRTKKVKRES
jgi:ankyrin repeat protein